MEKTEQTNTGTKEAAKGQPGKEAQGATVKAATVNGLAGLNNSALIEIVNNKAARSETRVAALREIHGRRGGQYSGLERLDADILAKVVEDKTIPQDLRAAAADALALPQTAQPANKS